MPLPFTVILLLLNHILRTAIEFSTPSSSRRHFQYAILLMLPNRPLLTFKYNTPCLQRLHHKPHTPRNINPIAPTLLTQHHIFYDRDIIIVSSHSNLASQDNERLILRWMPMDGNHSPRLHRIQKPMALLIQTPMKIIIHPQPRRFLSLRTNLIQQLLINNLHHSPNDKVRCPIPSDITTPDEAKKGPNRTVPNVTNDSLPIRPILSLQNSTTLQ